MTDEQLKLLKSLPVDWQIAILENEIQGLENRPPLGEGVWRWTPVVDMLNSLEELRMLLVEVKQARYQPVPLVPDPAPNNEWFHQIFPRKTREYQ